MNESSRRWLNSSGPKRTAAIILILAISGYGIFFGRGAYRHWKRDLFLKQTRAFLEKSDYRDAGISLKRAMLSDPTSIEAARLMAEMAERLGSPEAVRLRARVVELQPELVQNRLDWANTAVRLGDAASAEKALATLDESGRRGAGYHKVAAILALMRHEAGKAETHFAEAGRLDPTNAVIQLNLAVLRLVSTNTTVKTEARRQIERLSANPSVRCDALRTLAKDALQRAAFPEALSRCAELNKEPGSPFEDRILELDVMREAKDPRLLTRMTQLRPEAAAKPQTIFALARWMLESGKAGDAVLWLKTLKPEQLARQPAPLIAVECFAATGDWDSLAKMLESQNWGDLEYYRLALRAKVFRETGEPGAAKSAWLQALNATDSRLDRLSQLARTVGTWGWNDEQEEVAKAILSRFPSEKWALQLLVNRFYASGNTVALKNLLTRAAEMDPTNNTVRNNLAMTSLLLNPLDPKPHELAREIYRQQPTNAFFISTYAYALHLRERNREALELFQNLKPEQLEEPSVAAYYGIILNGAGNKTSARRYLELAERARLLPEEKNLLRQARRESP